MTLTDVFTFAIYALAVARVTGFLTSDKLIEQPRNALIRRWCGNDPEADCKSVWPYLLVCQWCMSIWVAPLFAAAWYYIPTNPLTLIPATWLAYSQLTGMISSVGR